LAKKKEEKLIADENKTTTRLGMSRKSSEYSQAKVLERRKNGDVG